MLIFLKIPELGGELSKVVQLLHSAVARANEVRGHFEREGLQK